MAARVKKQKNTDKTKLQISRKDLKKLQTECYNRAADRIMLLIFVAMKDELSYAFSDPREIDDLMKRVASRTERYSGFIDDKLLELKDMQEDLCRWLGRHVVGYSDGSNDSETRDERAEKE